MPVWLSQGVCQNERTIMRELVRSEPRARRRGGWHARPSTTVATFVNDRVSTRYELVARRVPGHRRSRGCRVAVHHANRDRTSPPEQAGRLDIVVARSYVR